MGNIHSAVWIDSADYTPKCWREIVLSLCLIYYFIAS